jgi:hypothetical protein
MYGQAESVHDRSHLPAEFLSETSAGPQPRWHDAMAGST